MFQLACGYSEVKLNFNFNHTRQNQLIEKPFSSSLYEKGQ